MVTGIGRKLAVEKMRLAVLNPNGVFNLHSDQGTRCTWPRYTEPRQYITTATVD